MTRKKAQKIEFVVKIIALIAILVGICILAASQFGENYNQKLDGQQVRIDWEYVNVRLEPNENSENIGRFYRGEEVVLTGKTYDLFGGEGMATDSWFEIQLEDESRGWIVASAT